MKVVFFANTDWYLYNFRLPLAKAIQKLGDEVTFVSPPGDYGAKLLTEGFRWRSVPMHRRSLNPFRELKLIFTLAALYRRERPVLAHHFTVKCVIYGTIAAKLAGIRCCVNAITGMGYVFSSQSFLARFLRPIVKLVLRVIFCSHGSKLIMQNPDDVEALVSQRIIASDKVRLIRGSGVNTSLFQPRESDEKVLKESSMPTFKVLLATRLLWDKGIQEYIEAARMIKKASEGSIDFFVAGSPDPGNPSSVTVEQIAKWEDEGIIKHLGQVENMAELLSKMDLVVLPSYREGVPRILIEAAASGLPIVATDVPGCREIVKHGLNGLLVPVRDPFALAAAIKHLRDNPSERIRLGAAGRAIAVAEFDEKLVIKDTLSVYRELLQNFRTI